MISLRKLQANRANARASTGPRSAAGKLQSARNARRHGLSIPVWSNPKLSAEARILILEIAGPDAAPELQLLARVIAESQIDLKRVRQTRHDVIASGFRLTRKTDGARKLALAISYAARLLTKLDRFERRALSRRDGAIRAFEKARLAAS
jgi:hypothetical protein